MDKKFDFEKVGKRMPYTVPDGFFDKLEQDVMAEIEQNATIQKKPRKRLLRFVGFAAAAAVALFIVITIFPQKQETPAADFETVRLAYSELSAEDQEFLQEIYNDDLFINLEDEDTDYEGTY